MNIRQDEEMEAEDEHDEGDDGNDNQAPLEHADYDELVTLMTNLGTAQTELRGDFQSLHQEI